MSVLFSNDALRIAPRALGYKMINYFAMSDKEYVKHLERMDAIQIKALSYKQWQQRIINIASNRMIEKAMQISLPTETMVSYCHTESVHELLGYKK